MKNVASFVGGAASVGLIVALAGVPDTGTPDPLGREGAPRTLPAEPGAGAETTPATFAYAPVDLEREPLQPIPADMTTLFATLGREHVPARIELGRALFHDARLSTDGALSCASCHDLRYAGIDRAITASGTDGSVGGTNTPTVYNVAFHTAHDWDGRAADLEAQARGDDGATGSPSIEWEEVAKRLSADPELAARAREAYPDASFRSGVPAGYWIQALGDFQRSLTTPDAPFDRYLLGDAQAVDESAKQGYQLFKDVGCAQCHDGLAVGGTRLAILGTARAYPALEDSGVDLGHYNVTGAREDRHRFKVPSLRNVALTAPYLHDGSIETLEEAVRAMAAHQLDRELTHGEVTRLVAFLESLTGERDGRPLGRLQNTAAHPARSAGRPRTTR